MLQSRISEDAGGYQEEFMLQFRHYKACLELFTMRPNKDTHQFAMLVRFIAAVSIKFPEETSEVRKHGEMCSAFRSRIHKESSGNDRLLVLEYIL